jgi:hypothetical protein
MNFGVDQKHSIISVAEQWMELHWHRKAPR